MHGDLRPRGSFADARAGALRPWADVIAPIRLTVRFPEAMAAGRVEPTCAGGRSPGKIPVTGCAGSFTPVPYTSTPPLASITPCVVAWPSSISLWALPDGIIGKQFSCFSTTQSKITGPS